MKSFLVIGNRLEQTMRCIEAQCKSRIILVHLGKVLNSAIYASRHDPCSFVWPATNKAQQWVSTHQKKHWVVLVHRLGIRILHPDGRFNIEYLRRIVMTRAIFWLDTTQK